MEKIRTFTDLIAWQEGHKLVLLVYHVTDGFPNKEIYSLIDQMRRCSVSVTSNLAEGFSRQSKKEKMQFYYMALGSLSELQNQLLISRDLKYLSEEDFVIITQLSVHVSKLINGLIKSLKSAKYQILPT